MRVLQNVLMVSLLACGAGQNAPAPAPIAIAPISPSAPSTCNVDLSWPPPPLPKPLPAAPAIDLATLVPPRPTGKPIAPRIELGKVELRMAECVRPVAEIDLSWKRLPDRTPRAGLSPDLARAWDEYRSSENALVDAMRAVAAVEVATQDCKREGKCSPEHLGCLAALLDRTTKERAARKERHPSDRETIIARFADASKKAKNASVELALGWLLESRARAEMDENPQPGIAEALVHYEAAKALSDAKNEVGWFARYHLALNLLDGADSRRARDELAALAVAPAREETAEVWYRLGEVETDDTKIRAAFGSAASSAKKDSPVYAIAMMKLFRLETKSGRHRAAVDTGAKLLGDLYGNGPDLDAELAGDVGFALDMLGAAEPGMPAVHPELYARVGREVAVSAVERFDLPAALHAWKQVLDRAKETTAAREKAPEATDPVKDDRADALRRVRALARRCANRAFGATGDAEVDLRVDAKTAGRGVASSRKISGDPGFAAAVKCFEESGGAWFVGAKSVHATIVLRGSP